MKRYIIILLCAIAGVQVHAQNSWDGYNISPVDTMRSLNIFVNIIYDINSSLNPVSGDGHWPYVTTESVRDNGPDYLTDFLDTEYTGSENVHGTMTKLYHESSFGNFIILGDFIVVNINHSTVEPDGGTFRASQLRDSCIALINREGFNTFGNHNSIADYDMDEDTVSNDIDLIQFMIRNGTEDYGGPAIAQGINGSRLNSLNLEIGGVICQADNYTYQRIGEGDLSNPGKSIVYHELAHDLFGDNSFHTSGGNHYRTSYTTTFMGLQGGYGLMGNANSGLISCNGFERWRMNWMHENNATGSPITAIDNATGNLTIADIDTSSNSVSFLLRDFVTFGDVIRIQLPYKETTDASEQYIWLENHQIGRNDALDFFQYANESCIPRGTPGIYSYIQVGKDARTPAEGTVWPSTETDNLLIISAEGNWDIESTGSRNDCLNWTLRNIGKYILPNPFCGENDQSQFFFPKSDTTTRLYGDRNHDAHWLGVKEKSDGSFNTSLPWLGDDNDAFTKGSVMDIGTNPAPVNAVTYYVTQFNGTIEPITTTRNNRTIYLTGLNITMHENGSNASGSIFQVDIRWDDYDVKNDVRWTGTIESREEVNLLSGNTILLDQNYTPIQRDRDATTGEFSQRTTLTCTDGSQFTLQTNSQMIVENRSELILESGSTFEINDGALLIIRHQGLLEVQNGANLIIRGTGRVIIECNGNFCANSGANLNLVNPHSVIDLFSDHNIPGGCLNSFSVTGLGSINNNYTSTETLTSDITTDDYISGQNINTSGAVNISNNANVIFNAEESVVLGNSFSVAFGSSLSIRTAKKDCQ